MCFDIICITFVVRTNFLILSTIFHKITRNSEFPPCKISIGNNFETIEDRTMRFACRRGFSAMADRMVWPPSLSRDRIDHAHRFGVKQQHVTLVAYKLEQSITRGKCVSIFWTIFRKKTWNSLFPPCSICNKSASKEDRTVRCEYNRGFSAMEDRMVWLPSFSRDRNWRRRPSRHKAAL